MTDILDNALIRKYFGCEVDACDEAGTVDHDWLNCLARKVLTAMQEPIRKGERILLINNNSRLEPVSESTKNYELEGFHPWDLRLPSRFQEAGKKECEGFDTALWCQKCGLELRHVKPQPPPESCSCPDTSHNFCGRKLTPAEPEKCDHDPNWELDTCKRCNPFTATDAVEAKIKELCSTGWIGGNSFRIPESGLRELVKLCRGEK